MIRIIRMGWPVAKREFWYYNHFLLIILIIQLLIIQFIQRERLLVGKALYAGNVSDHPNGLSCCLQC